MKPKDFFSNLQEEIVKGLETLDTNKFIVDNWESKLGVGRTAVIENGSVFEKGGVAFSEVSGKELPPSATANRPELDSTDWKATGVSLVIHPWNPHAPTVHMNTRYFEAGDVWWFGGGIDLTPYYGYNEDCVHHHSVLKNTCNKFDNSLYPEFKKDCDNYFYIKHRNEQRGIGGIFFDDFDRLGYNKSFQFTQEIGRSFLDIYLPIMDQRKDIEYTESQREWQLHRRSRYVEFNLVYDRGTIFGLQSGGRAESILMSMPPVVKWNYDYNPKEGTEEHNLLNNFLLVKDWV